jgi:hypothetical protein
MSDRTNARDKHKNSPGAPTSPDVVRAVRRLAEALKAEYGSDFAYSVVGRGYIVAASNYIDGNRPAVPHSNPPDHRPGDAGQPGSGTAPADDPSEPT